MSEQWPNVPLSDIAKPVSRPVAVIPGESFRTIGVKWWGEGAYERQTIDGSRTAAKTLSVVRKGDLIINKIWVRHGSTAIAGPDVDGCAASGEFPTFELDPERVVPQWVHWQTKTPGFWSKCDALSQGTSGKNRIKPDLFLTIPVPLPPLAEQRRIVARIEELAAQIHEARTLRHQAAEEAEALMSTFLGRAFAQHAAKFTTTRVLSELAHVRGGGTPSKHNPAFWDGSIPWVSPKDMKVPDILDSQDHITEEAVRGSATSLIPKDSVLVVVRSGILRRTLPVAINRVPVTTNQDMKALTPVGALLPEFLRWWFRGNETRLLQSVKGGTTVQSLVWDHVLNSHVSLPPLPEQRRIVAELDALQAQVDALKRLQAETAAELDALLPAILDKAFKGEL